MLLDTKYIKDERKFIMGCAIIMVLLVHAVDDGAGYGIPKYIVKLASYGAWGVDVFLFLSGVGWYWSYKKWGGQSELFGNTDMGLYSLHMFP